MSNKVIDSIVQPPVIMFVFFISLMGLAFMVLRMNYALPLWVPAIATLSAFMLGSMYAFHLMTDWNYLPEAADFIYARKTGTPLLMVEAHNGWGKWVRGLKLKTGDIFFGFNRDANEGIHIDPAVQSGSAPLTRMEKNLNVYHYGTSSPFTMGSKQAVAMDTILEYVKKYYPDLGVFDDQTILEYLARNRNELPHDCKNLASIVDVNIVVPETEVESFIKDINEKVEKKAKEQGIEDETKILEEKQKIYDENIRGFIVDYRANWLVKTFMKIQDETSRLPLPKGKLFSYASAFINVPTTFTAFDFQTLLHLFEMIARKESDIDMKWLFGACAAIGVLALLGGLAYVIIKGAT